MNGKLSDGLLDRLKAMFACDEARITSPAGRHYLILGWKRNTRDSEGQWTRDGEPFDFDFLEEKVIASGNTEEELTASAEHYKALLKGGWREFFRSEGITVTPELEAVIANAERVRPSSAEGSGDGD